MLGKGNGPAAGPQAVRVQAPPPKDWVVTLSDGSVVRVNAVVFQFNDDGSVVFIDEHGLGKRAFASGYWRDIDISRLA